MNAKLKDILERVETWPEGIQEEAAELLLALEQEHAAPYEATPDELEAIDRGLRDAAEGRFATSEQVEAVFAKYRRK
jgi:predicted transcriptional regulator